MSSYWQLSVSARMLGLHADTVTGLPSSRSHCTQKRYRKYEVLDN